MRVSREYIVPVTFTAILHSLLLLWIMGSFLSDDRVFEIPQPKMVRATLVSMEQKKKKGPQQEFKQPKPKAMPKVAVPEPAKEEPVKKPEPKKPEPVKKPDPVPQIKPEPEKPKIDTAKLKEDAEKQRKKEEELKRQKEEEQRKKAELEKKRLDDQKRREEALLNSLPDDDSPAQEESSPDGAEEVSAESYIALIQRTIISNWNRPITARNGMQVLLRIQLIPTGDVVGVSVAKSSGDFAFDRSAVAAVEKSQRFPELAELDSRTFEKNFRTFTLIFNPQDLRL